VYAFRMWSCGLVGGKRSVLGAASECHCRNQEGLVVTLACRWHAIRPISSLHFHAAATLPSMRAANHCNVLGPLPPGAAVNAPVTSTVGLMYACATYGDAGGSRASYGTRPAEAGESGWGCDFRLGSSLPVARDLGTLRIPPAGAMDAQHRRPIQPTWPMSLTGGPAQ
jgi:hypothetical protein